MFTAFEDPGGNFSFFGMPSTFFMDPSPFGNGALLVLKQYKKNFTAVSGIHGMGIKLAAAQVMTNFGRDSGALEIYGLTDRTGTETVNKTISLARARSALAAIKGALGLSDFHMTSAMGLGERMADEYLGDQDETDDTIIRGVACYFWESISTARDTALVISIKFARPPNGTKILAPLFLGRFQSSPASPFA